MIRLAKNRQPILSVEIFDYVNIKDKRYRTKELIESFIDKTGHVDAVQRCYAIKHVSGMPSKLCYESTYPCGDTDFKIVEGLAFCLNENNPSSIAYGGVLYDGALYTGDASSFNIVSLSRGVTEYNRKVVSTSWIMNAVKTMESMEVSNLALCAGETLIRSMTSSMIASSGIRIQVSPDLIAKATYDMMASGERTVRKFYNFLAKRIIERRNSGKDMTWFMFKLMLARKILMP